MTAAAPPRYDPHAIEARRQQAWRERDAHRTPPLGDDRPHLYIKPSAPFTSGNVHIGHVRSYSIGDAYARFRRARGDDVLFAFGFDAFGLPAELTAISSATPPALWVDEVAAHMTEQLDRLGFSFDWDRSFKSSDPIMYRWSQWLFITLLEAGLVYRGTGNVDWCDTCQTTLATIQVEDGRCWRCHNPVRLIERPQWYLRISAYVEENDRRLEELRDWDENSLASQRFVIGRVDGVEMDLTQPSRPGAPGDGRSLTVFTVHADALSEARFVLLSPKHPAVDEWISDPDIDELLEELRSVGLERAARDAEAIAVIDTGHEVRSPAGDTMLPVLISPVVDGRFGPTAALGIPALDRTDAVIADRLDAGAVRKAKPHPSPDRSGVTASGSPDRPSGLASPPRPAVRYRADDFSISRQRSWGTPIPIVYCDRCGTVPVPRDQLPVLLPRDITPTGTGNPLAELDDFVNTTCPGCGEPARRETDTLDCHFDALWLWVPVCVPPEAREAPLEQIWALADLRHWLPCARVVAGSDSGNFVFDQRTVTKALRDLGYLSFLSDGEPFAGCLFHEMVIASGRKMSKHLGNVVDPDDLVERFGADTVRLAVLYAAGPAKALNWSDSAVLHCHRFLTAVWEYTQAKLAEATRVPGGDGASLGGDGATLRGGARVDGGDGAGGDGDDGSRARAHEGHFEGVGAEIPEAATTGDSEAVGERVGGPADARAQTREGGSDKTEHLRRKLREWTETGVRRTTVDMESLEMHSAVRDVMRLFERIKGFEQRVVERDGSLSAVNMEALLEALATLAAVLGPFVPHMAEELSLALGQGESATQMPWPGVSLGVAA